MLAGKCIFFWVAGASEEGPDEASTNYNYVNRFGHDWDPHCMKMDETLFGCAEKVKNFATIYLVDISKVPGVTSKAFLITC